MDIIFLLNDFVSKDTAQKKSHKNYHFDIASIKLNELGQGK